MASDLHHCIDIFSCPAAALKLAKEDRRTVITGITKTSEPGGFRKDELATKAPISFLEEAAVVIVLAVVMGTRASSRSQPRELGVSPLAFSRSLTPTPMHNNSPRQLCSSFPLSS